VGLHVIVPLDGPPTASASGIRFAGPAVSFVELDRAKHLIRLEVGKP
jgi:hypothetical protein